MAKIAIEQPSETDIDVIHGVLTKSYWSPGIARGIVAKACANSMCATARDDEGKLIGFARGLTESDRLGYATYMSADRRANRPGACR